MKWRNDFVSHHGPSKWWCVVLLSVIIITCFSSVIALPPSTRVILWSLRVLSVKFCLIVLPKFSIVSYSLHIKVIVEIVLCLLWVKRFLALLYFLHLLRRRFLVIIDFLRCSLMMGDWLHLTCFSFVGAWILRTFEDMYLNFSNSPGRTFLRDNS